MSIIIILSLIILFIFLIFMIFFKTLDYKKYMIYLLGLNASLFNNKIAQLKNANTLSNLPFINMNNTDSEIQQLMDCRTKPVFLGKINELLESVYLDKAKTLCGSNAVALEVEGDDEIYINGYQLTEGVWATIDPPNCNSKTSFVMATVSDIKCMPKYPRLFGGNDGNTIIACGGKSILWDNLKNEAVDTMTVEMTDEDEVLPDGSFRFTCKFGPDDNGNLLVAHPHNRFIPIRNNCIDNTPSVHPDIRTTETYACDCGDFSETRMKNKNPDDKYSKCTACFSDDDHFMQKCFTLFSPANYIGECHPCNPEKFLQGGNECQKIEKPKAEMSLESVSEEINRKMYHYKIHFNGLDERCETTTVRIQTVY